MIRFSRASWLFGRILFSYLFLWLLVRLRGRKRMKRWIRRTHRLNARRLYRGFLRLRGVYIKIGQVLSILGSFLPRQYIEELEGLQDQVPAKRYKTIRRTFLKDRHEPPETYFSEFAPTPIAAASLGQVHEARLKSGEKVAVKVLYPNIERIIRIDLRVVRWVAWVYTRLVPSVGTYENILDQLEDVLTRETDYVLEAENLERLAANFEESPEIAFPRVFHDVSSKRILVMEFMEGIRIKEVEEMREAGINPTDIATVLVKSYYKQLLIDGLYHADPHPGNFLVREGPQLVFLDFGAVEPVRKELRLGMIQFLQGLIAKDDDKALEGIETMGFVAPDGNRRLLEKTVRHYFTKMVTIKIEDFSRLDVEDFVTREEMRAIRGRLKELMRSVQYPKGYFYIERSLILLFGLCATLDPTVNAIELGFPYAMQFILNNQPPAEAQSETSPPPPAPAAPRPAP